MCKVMMMAGINDSNRKLAWEFTKLMAAQMSPGNSDGLGYAAVTTDGELFGERWHNNNEAFTVRHTSEPPSKEETILAEKYKGFLVQEQKPIRYNKFGSINEESTCAITLHTRMATSGKQFINTHPFVRGGTSLIHNGVIGNARELEMIQSTCDSEAILNLYVNNSVTNNPAGIQKVAHKLQGYYACGVLTETKKYGYVLDIFKDSRARLSGAFIRDMGIMVFATVLDDILAVCEKMCMEVAYKYTVNEGVLIRLSTLTGEPFLTQEFEPSFKEKPKKKSTKEIVDGMTITSDDPVYNDTYDYLRFPRTSWRGE